jgi:hypothetical protein
VIRLPIRLIRDNEYESSFLTANRNFVYGGTFDKSIQIFVIDAKDISIVPSIDDYLIIGDSRFNIKDVSKLDYNQGYLITAEAIEGDFLNRLFEETVTQALSLGSEVTYEHTT